ncbi:MAG: DNA-directed RNA polymerase subunit alpha [Planctomycetota bacterium]
MRVRWRGFELPTRVVADKDVGTPTYGKFVVEPFMRGFATTVGNSIRRVLLSSIEGAAVTSVRIKGVEHEFSTLKGVREDITDIVLNLKKLRIRMHTDDPRTMRLEVKKKGLVTGKDIQTDPTVEIADPDHVLVTLTEDVEFVAEMTVRKGRGYVTAEENAKGHHEIGLIHVDSIFSPVLRVNYKAENTRVGQMTNYDKLTIEIWTDGTVTPDMALVEASKILRKHLNAFVGYFDAGVEIPTDGQAEEEEKRAQFLEGVKPILDKDAGELNLSVRASNCLRVQNIGTIRDLVQRSEEDLLKIRNFGKTSLSELKEKLKPLGLTLGMRLS